MKCFKNSITDDDGQIDYEKKTPYTFETIEIHKGVKYKIIHTVTKGVADSRIINYEFIKIGEEIEWWFFKKNEINFIGKFAS